AEKAISTRREQLRPVIIAQLREKARGEAQKAAAQSQQNVGVMQQLEKDLTDQIRRLNEDLRFLANRSFDLEMLRREIDQTESMAKKVGNEKEALEVETEGAPSRVTLVDRADPQHSPRDYKIQAAGAAAAGLGSLLVVFFLVAWREFQARRVSTAED